ncbi:MAG TPA: TIGR01906 family membrane protein [Chloroflexota bacterium]|nr:TIGR01906 family membrane protein [Chloroflexota bacterium]
MRWQPVVRLVLRLGVAICAASIPVAMVSTVVLGLFYDSSFYRSGQIRYQVAYYSGLSQDQINRIDDGIVRFFSTTESLPASVVAAGGPADVFNEREVLHMNDVRSVIWVFGKFQIASLLAIGLFALLGAITWSRGGRSAIARGLIYSSIVTIVIGVAAVGLTLVGFDTLFITFHELVFHNDFWQLDPRTDHLVQIFPFEFWYDAMLAVALRVVLVTVVLGGVGFTLGRVGRVPSMQR